MSAEQRTGESASEMVAICFEFVSCALSTEANQGPVPGGSAVDSGGAVPPPTISPIESRAATSAAPSEAAASDEPRPRRSAARAAHDATPSAAAVAAARATATAESPPSGSYEAVPAATTTPSASQAGRGNIDRYTVTWSRNLASTVADTSLRVTRSSTVAKGSCSREAMILAAVAGPMPGSPSS